MVDPVVAADGTTFERAAIEGEGCDAPAAGLTDADLPFAINSQGVTPCPIPVPALDCPPACLCTWIEHQQRASQAPVSPLTNLPLSSLELRPNLLVRSLVDSFKAAGLLE
jgi:hypothetical protein